MAVPAAQVQAVLDMSNLTAFEQLLGGLTSVDNAARTQYESLFNECKKQGDVLCLQLVKRAATTADAQHRGVHCCSACCRAGGVEAARRTAATAGERCGRFGLRRFGRTRC